MVINKGFFLNLLFRIGTKDPTNMFKAYDKSFVEMVQIESDVGFTKDPTNMTRIGHQSKTL